MKIGFQTIVWGPRVENVEYMLDVIAGAGFEGVEFMQRPEVLGNINHIVKLLKERNLELIGLTGGSLAERMEFCGEFRPEYLYVDTWDEEAAFKAMDKGFTVGLHVHAYMLIRRLADALSILEAHPKKDFPKLKFIPDTAHLTVAHDDPVAAIELTKDRIAAIHLKDWSPEFGRSAHRYARGFVDLGVGSVDLDGVLDKLDEIDYEGWIVAEQDYALAGPVVNTLASATWLAKNDLLSRAPEPAQQIESVPDFQPYLGVEWTCAPEKEVLFLRSIGRAHLQDIDALYTTVAGAFSKLISSKFVEIWTCSPAQDIMSLVAVQPDPGVALETFIPNRRGVLSGATMERKTVTHFDLTYKENAELFEHPGLIKRLNLKKAVSVPIFNPWNFNHVRLIINLFSDARDVSLNDSELFRFGEYVAFAVDSTLEDVCSSCATKVNFIASRCDRVTEFLKLLLELIRESINCKNAAVFLINDAGNKLEVTQATTGTTWSVPKKEQFYRKGEGLTGCVWESKKTLLVANASREPQWQGKSFEGEDTREEDAGLFVPLTRLTGEVVGVVRCRNKSAARTLGKSKVFSFSDDDAAILEAVVQAAIPHLELLLDQERRVAALGKLTHELMVPLVAIRGVVQFMKETIGVEKIFAYDYLGDLWSWSELMGRLIDNAEVYSAEGLRIKPTLTRLLSGIIAPAIKQVRLLLKERTFSKDKIRYRGFERDRFPKLWLDRNQFQQVLFNLLSNAIKYAYDNPDKFKVEIVGTERGAEFIVLFRDWGPGIEVGMEEAIFEEGVRSESAVNMDVTGQGLGLWIVRRIVERHGGRIKVGRPHDPTEFAVYLPYSLRSRVPS